MVSIGNKLIDGASIGNNVIYKTKPAKFVAVSTASKIAYSYDGIKWVEIDSPIGGLNSVCYGNGKFVACGIGSDLKAIYSENGISWKETTMACAGNHLCYGNGLFVNASNSNFQYSTDGIHWTKTTAPGFYNEVTAVLYDDGTFVALVTGTTTSIDSSKALYSDNGINWNIVSLAYLYKNGGVCGNGKFIGLGNKNNDISSDKGRTWSTYTCSTSGWNDGCYGNGKYIAVATGQSKIMYSLNGTSWTESYVNSSGWVSICYGNGKFVAVNQSSAKVMYSTDGINWTETTNGLTSINWSKVCVNTD